MSDPVSLEEAVAEWVEAQLAKAPPMSSETRQRLEMLIRTEG